MKKWTRGNKSGPPKYSRRFCTKCQDWKDLSEFYKDARTASGYRSWCKECGRAVSKKNYHVNGSIGKLRNKKTIENRSILKQRLVDAAGGKCSRCGYNKSLSALDFHHKNGDEKNNTLTNLITVASSGRGARLQEALDEASKCILLCANCHRELHAGEWHL